MAINSLVTVTKASKANSIILVADSDFYFSDLTKVTSIADVNPNSPKMTVTSVKVLGQNKRRLLVRFKAEAAAAPAGGVKAPALVPEKAGDIVTGAITITLANPTATPVIGVGYIDDETP